MSVEQIERADAAEELAAGMALQLAATKDELISVWWREAEAFEGEARERLQAIFADMLRKFGVLQP
jgi:hypothetical protein